MIPISESVLYLKRDYEKYLFRLAIEVVDYMLVMRMDVVVYAEQEGRRFFTVVMNGLNRYNREDIKSMEKEEVVLKNGSRLRVCQYKDYNVLRGNCICLIDLDDIHNAIICKIVTDQFSRVALKPTMVLLGSDKKIGRESILSIPDAQTIQGFFKDKMEEEVS